MANSLPKKTMVLDTGFVSSGTIVPFSYSPESAYIVVTMANSMNTRLPPLKVMAKYGFCETPKDAGKTKDIVAKMKAKIRAPMNIFLRMFQSIS